MQTSSINIELISKLKSANKILFFTGAGISAESGIPTFRGKDGIWNKLKPEELANFNAFLKNPDLVWEWYQYRRKIVNETNPNKGHYAIKEFENYYSEVNVVTQNVDNLHRRAGTKNIFELHGNIERNYCVDCYKNFDNVESDNSKVPHCKYCGGLIRPDVVWFGEMLPQEIFSEAEQKAKMCDICFVVGTTGIVYPAAYIPMIAKENGACMVEINLAETEISDKMDLSLFGKSGEILPLIITKVREMKLKN